MSDEERIERLTELARRVWPGAEVTHGYGDDAWIVAHESGVPLSIDHPRALDALEAALLVLACEPPPWVEKLASEWGQLADRLDGPTQSSGVAHAVATLRDAAGILRSRAKGEP